MLCLGYRRVGLGYRRGLGGTVLHPWHFTLYQSAPGHGGGSRLLHYKATLSPDAAARSHKCHLLLHTNGRGSVVGFQR